MNTTIELTYLARVTVIAENKARECKAVVLMGVGRDKVASKPLTSSWFSLHAVGTELYIRVKYNMSTSTRKVTYATNYAGGAHKFSTDFAQEIADNQVAWDNLAERMSLSTPTTRVVSKSDEPKTRKDDHWSDAFFVQDEERNAFAMAKKLASTLPTKVMIIGASGYGKTSLPKAFAKQNGMEYVRFNVALVRDPEEFFGFRTVKGGDVEFVPSEFTKAIRKGNCVVVLDELNRATPEMANALFPILDDDAKTVVFGEEIVVGENTIIVATINVGFQFVGTYSIDQALLNRMDITLRVAPLPAAVEKEILVRRTGVGEEDAFVIVNICNRLRDLTNAGTIEVDASTRTSIRIARSVSNGASLQDAFAWAIVNAADIEERKEVIDAISSLL